MSIIGVDNSVVWSHVKDYIHSSCRKECDISIDAWSSKPKHNFIISFVYLDTNQKTVVKATAILHFLLKRMAKTMAPWDLQFLLSIHNVYITILFSTDPLRSLFAQPSILAAECLSIFYLLHSQNLILFKSFTLYLSLSTTEEPFCYSFSLFSFFFYLSWSVIIKKYICNVYLFRFLYEKLFSK